MCGHDIRELSCYSDKWEVLVEVGTAVDVQFAERHAAAVGVGEVQPGMVSVMGTYCPEASINFLSEPLVRWDFRPMGGVSIVK